MGCPACGGSATLEVGPDRPPSTSLSDAVLDATEDERLDVVQACWDCGWQEEHLHRVEAINTTAGGADAIERVEYQRMLSLTHLRSRGVDPRYRLSGCQGENIGLKIFHRGIIDRDPVVSVSPKGPAGPHPRQPARTACGAGSARLRRR